MRDHLIDQAAPDPRDAAAAEEIRAIASLLRAVPVPSARLPGWQSLCAREYGAAVHLLVRELALADAALAAASRAAG